MALTPPPRPRLAVLLSALLLSLAGLVAIGTETAPIGLGQRALPSPDLLVCVVVVWVVRIPEAAATVLVFALGVVRDLVGDVPDGLGALSLLLVAELTRRHRAALARLPFVVEWLWFAAVLALMLALQWLGLLLTLARPPYLVALLQQYGATVLVYPAAMLLCRWGLGVRAEPAARRLGAAAEAGAS